MATTVTEAMGIQRSETTDELWNGEYWDGKTTSTQDLSLAYRKTFTDLSYHGNFKDPTNYEFSKNEETVCTGSLLVSTVTPSRRLVVRTSGPLFPYEPGLPRSFDTSYNACVSNLYEQIRGGLDLSVALGELGATRRMFKTARKLSRYIYGFHPRYFAKHWLEYQYGWKPLMSDLYNSVREVTYVAPQIQRFKARGSMQASRSKVTTSDGLRKTVVQQENYRTEMEVLFQPPADSQVSNLARLSSLNPASIAWELTPFSFVFDWFIDVGSYMRDLESSLIYDAAFKSGRQTRTYSVNCTTTITGIGKVSSSVSKSGTLTGSLKLRGLNRVPLNSLPKPQLPRFTPALGPSRLVTAAALLKVLFIEEPEMAKPKRRITVAKLDKQLQNLKRGPRFKKWSNDFVW